MCHGSRVGGGGGGGWGGVFFFNDTATTEIYTLSLHDALPIWVANCLELKDQDWLGQQKQLIDALVAVGSRAIVVAEETGWGVVPAYPLGRQFRDRLGTLTRTVALHSSQVFLVVAGYAVDIKQHGREVPDLGQNLGQTFEGGKGQSVKKVE